jgi:ubiquinone/menaquinone biosynthesis C-methylase UbiE
MGTGAGKPERYMHGYEDWTRRWMQTRTVERDLAFLVPHLATGRKAIDCGCGPGSITVGLAEAVKPAEVIGMDIEPRQLEAARELAAERKVDNVRFEQGSIYEIPFPDASFDVAVAHFVIEHLSDPPRALREMRRVLRPGGVAAIKDPYYPAFVFRPQTPEVALFWELMARWQQHNGASTTYSADLRAHLLDAGFSRTEATGGLTTLAGTGESAVGARMMLVNQVREAAFRDAVLGNGWATEAQLDAISKSADGFAERPDVFGFVVYVQALGFV